MQLLIFDSLKVLFNFMALTVLAAFSWFLPFNVYYITNLAIEQQMVGSMGKRVQRYKGHAAHHISQNATLSRRSGRCNGEERGQWKDSKYGLESFTSKLQPSRDRATFASRCSPNATQTLRPIAKKKPAITQGSPHFREQAEAWLAEALGEGAAALMVDRPRG